MIGQIETILRSLQEAGVRYLVAGGVAVVLHGHLRTTADLDLIVHLERDNLLRALDALGRAGFRPMLPVDARDFANADKRHAWVREKGMLVFSLWRETGGRFVVDLFATEPLDFEDAWDRRLQVDLGTTTIQVVSLRDLIALKVAAGRPQDLEDLRALRAFEEE